AKGETVRPVKDGKTLLLRDDYTGTVEAVNLPLLTQFIGPGRVPVVAPLALSTENEAVNVDGDRVAARIAVAIDADALLILTNVPGLLRDANDPSSLVAETTLEEAEKLAQGRMKNKLLAARDAIEGCVGGQGSANLGHGNVAVADAIAAQARTLASCTELFYNDRRAELYDVLASLLPASLDRVFLCNSGTEAVEGALKFARAATKRTG